MLEFMSTQKRHFYWMRDDDASKDAENELKVHNALNGQPLDQARPAKPQAQAPTQAPPTQQAPVPGQRGDQQQFQNFFSDPNVMQQFLQAMNNQQQQVGSPGLSSIMRSEQLLKLVEEHPEVRAALLPHLPPGQQTEEALRENLLSP